MATTPKTIESNNANEAAKKRLRSPAYPYLNLETAIKRAKTFYDREGRNAAPITVTATHWGYEAKSSGGMQTVAALMSFGLMQDEGTGNKRKVKLTQNALKILLDTRPDSAERNALIKQAALAPRVHQQIWDKWRTGISDPNLRHALIFEWEPRFNENSVDGFIREYRDTIAFAKLTESDKVTSEDGDKAGTGTEESYIPKVGDYVQWEPKGILQFKEPKRVREICSDGKHALVDGSYVGLPISELTLERAPIVAPKNPESFVPPSPNKTMQEFVVPLSGGNRAVFQWPTALSKEDVEDLKDSLKMLERKIMRPVSSSDPAKDKSE